MHLNKDSVPIEWVQMIRNSSSYLKPKFRSNYMLREYTKKLYLPALDDYKMLNENGVELAPTLTQYQTRLVHSEEYYGDNIHWGDPAGRASC